MIFVKNLSELDSKHFSRYFKTIARTLQSGRKYAGAIRPSYLIIFGSLLEFAARLLRTRFQY